MFVFINHIHHIERGNFYVGDCTYAQDGVLHTVAFKTDYIEGDVKQNNIAAGETAVRTSYNNMPQIQFSCLVEPVSVPQETMALLLPKADIDVNKAWNNLIESIESLPASATKEATLKLLNDNAPTLRTLPAAISVHHNYLHGWLEHTANMVYMAKQYATTYYDTLDPTLLICATALHDIGKLREFKNNPVGLCSEYTREGYMLGHTILGQMLYQEVDPDNWAMLNAIGAHADKLEFGASCRPSTPEAIILQKLDYLDSRIKICEGLTPEANGLTLPVNYLDGLRMSLPGRIKDADTDKQA